MEEINIGKEFLSELESEVPATRKCLERIPASLYDWKPHEKSMAMGYLTLLVASIPRWITLSIEKSEIDFATFEHFQPRSTEEMLNHFEENMRGVRKALGDVSNEALSKPFYLKDHGRILFTSPKKENISSSINHLVHHRGQLTVYMRLNGILVPSIYGPSADDRIF
jgi:uncharacterized damage-inducible protein DinB